MLKTTIGQTLKAISGLFSSLYLHLLYLIFQHTLDFVAHGFLAGLAEMNPHNVGSPANLLHQCGSVLSRCCGGSVLCDFLVTHKCSFSCNQVLLFLTHNLLRRRFGRPGSFLPEILTGKENRRTPFQYAVINPCVGKVCGFLISSSFRFVVTISGFLLRYRLSITVNICSMAYSVFLSTPKSSMTSRL